MLGLAPVTPDTSGFERLLAESIAQEHRMLLRFEENWRSGVNVFGRHGEIMLGAWIGETLAGVCGRNIDPYDPSPRAGRVRHLYVAADNRREGVGRLLIGAILEDAATYFDYLNTNAPQPAFPFYERLGFKRLDQTYATHRIMLAQD